MLKNLAHDVNEKPRTNDILYGTDHGNFDSLLLSAPLLSSLLDAGFFKPSPIQLKAIPLGKCGLDLIVKAKSGTGKTLVFGIIALEMIDTTRDALQVLIIAPTREIADQIVSVITTIGRHIEGLNVGLFIGGLSVEKDVKTAKKCHIAVGSPGRIKHLVEKDHLDVKSVKLFVLDEADKLMEMDFQSDINYLYYQLPEQKQFLAVSATIPSELDLFLNRYMRSPRFVTPEFDSSVLLGLRQFVTVVERQNNIMKQISVKLDALVKLLSEISFTQCLVFSNYKARTESVSRFLNQQGWKAMCITSTQSQVNRLKTVNKLKKLECKILLSTDLTARGIDASNVDLVVNFDIPWDAETYLHRMGRAGRYGSLGLCVTIASVGDEVTELKKLLGDIGGSEMNIAQLPTGKIVHDLWKDDLNLFEQVFGISVDREKTSWELTESAVNSSNKFDNLASQSSRSEVDHSEEDALDTTTVSREHTDSNVNISRKLSGLTVTNLKNAGQNSTIGKGRVSTSYDSTKLDSVDVGEMKKTSSDLFETFAQDENPECEPIDFIVNNSKATRKWRDSTITDSNSSVKPDDNIEKMLHMKEIEEKNIAAQLLNISSADLLKSLAQGENLQTPLTEVKVNQPSLNSEIVSPADLYPWVPVEQPVLSNHNKDSLNLLDTSDCSICSEDNFTLSEEIFKKKSILSKNVALYHSAKMLQSQDWDVNVINEAVKPIQDYFNIVQEDSDNFTGKLEKAVADVDNAELCQKITQYTEQFTKAHLEKDTVENPVEENICKAAYDYIINGTNDWRDMVEIDSKIEDENIVAENEIDVVMEPEAYDEASAFDLDPVQYQHYKENFSEYYDYYSGALAKAAPHFNDAAEVKRFMEQWQAQVKSVTNYVQQKIYLQEMNNYEYYYGSHQ